MSVPLKGDEKWMARKLGWAKKNDKKKRKKNGGERERERENRGRVLSTDFVSSEFFWISFAKMGGEKKKQELFYFSSLRSLLSLFSN